MADRLAEHTAANVNAGRNPAIQCGADGIAIKLLVYRRAYFTLVELLVAIGLTMVILSTMMYFYWQVDWLNTKFENQQQASFNKLYLDSRLADILPRAISPHDPKKDFFFFTSSYVDGMVKQGTVSLVFTFDNGVKLDPSFSNHVLGRLFLDTDKRLCLAIWPSPERWEEGKMPPIKKEVLAVGIEDLSFEFYAPPEKNRKKVWERAKIKNDEKQQVLKLDAEGGWKSEWQSDYRQLPGMIRITLERGDAQKGAPGDVFMFPLPATDWVVLYDR